MELSPRGLGVLTQKSCMPLSCLCLLIYLSPNLQPDATCPVHLHTQDCSFNDRYLFISCLWPGRLPGMGQPLRRQTIMPVLGEQKFYQRSNATFLWPSPLASPSTAQRPALLELRPMDAVQSEHDPYPKKAPLWTHNPSASATPCPVPFSACTTI